MKPGVLALAAFVAACGRGGPPVPCEVDLDGICFVRDDAAPPASGALDEEEVRAVVAASANAWGVPASAIAGWCVIVTSGPIECPTGRYWGCTDWDQSVIRIFDDGHCALGAFPHEFGHAAAGLRDHDSPVFIEVDWPQSSFLEPILGPRCRGRGFVSAYPGQ